MSKELTIVSVGRIHFQLNQDTHTVRTAQVAETLAARTISENRNTFKAAVADTPLAAGEALQAEVRSYLVAVLGATVDLSAFSFTTCRSTADETGIFWLNGAEHLTRLPVVGSLKGKL